MTKFNNLIEALDAAPENRRFITYWIDEDEQQSVTFAEFRQRARMQASTLHDQGVSVGDRVIVIMPQGIPAMTAFVAVMMLGAVPAFLAYPNFKIEPSKYRSGLSGVTANLNAKAVIIDDQFPEELLGCVTLSGPAQLLRYKDLDPSDLGAIERNIHISSLKNSPDSLAFIQHSAGTTGLQKGIALTHGAVLRHIQHLAQALKIAESTDSIYSWLPLYHDMGLIACFILPLVFHLPIVMQSPVDWVMQPETMLQIITEHKCTLAWMPNFAFQFVPRRTRQDRWEQYNLSSLRALINCSEPVRSSSMQEFQAAFASIGFAKNALQSSYAMAENVFAVTQSDISRSSGPTRIWADGRQFRSRHSIARVAKSAAGPLSFTSSGRLLPNCELKIVSDTGELLDDGHVGEILIKSDSLFAGYYNRPDLTATGLIDGWYHTGDLGFRIEDELFVVGRKKDLLIVGGENLYPQDIEEIVGSHSTIRAGRVVAIGVYNPDIGTDEIVVVAEVECEDLLVNPGEIEREVRNLIVAGIGVAVRSIFLKPPKWIVKSTAGKPARSATRAKLLREHPELDRQPDLEPNLPAGESEFS